MHPNQPLPPGQHEFLRFPRFGLPEYALRVPDTSRQKSLTIIDDAGHLTEIGFDVLGQLRRVEQDSGLHCVTTWSRSDLHWSGFRFRDFYERLVLPAIQPEPPPRLIIFHGLDGFSTSIHLEDALAPDILLADTLDGQPLTLAHGAPIRFVAPQHYAYKSVKHLRAMEFRHEIRPPAHRLVDHPRGRVANEERGPFLPGWLLSYLYRPLIWPAVWMFDWGLKRYFRKAKGA